MCYDGMEARASVVIRDIVCDFRLLLPVERRVGRVCLFRTVYFLSLGLFPGQACGFRPIGEFRVCQEHNDDE